MHCDKLNNGHDIGELAVHQGETAKNTKSSGLSAGLRRTCCNSCKRFTALTCCLLMPGLQAELSALQAEAKPDPLPLAPASAASAATGDEQGGDIP